MVKTNDMHLVIYISSLIRCVIQLHDLVNNKIVYKEDDFTSLGLESKLEDKSATMDKERYTTSA